LKYRFGGAEKRLALGVYPESLSPKRALAATGHAHRSVTASIPAKRRRRSEQLKARAKFATVAADWFALKRKSWAPETARRAEFVVARYLCCRRCAAGSVFPAAGGYRRA
jgi:hypothetical protein